MSDKFYCGWDNGISGAGALLLPDGPEFFATPLTHAGKDNIVDARALQAWFAKRESVIKHVGVEQPQKQPRFGACGNFSQGDSGATIRTVLVLLGIPFTLIPPRKWQAAMHMGVRGANMDTKTASFEACARLFPNVTIPGRPSEKTGKPSSKPDDGFADALLIAAFCERHRL